MIMRKLYSIRTTANTCDSVTNLTLDMELVRIYLEIGPKAFLRDSGVLCMDDSLGLRSFSENSKIAL